VVNYITRCITLVQSICKIKTN